MSKVSQILEGLAQDRIEERMASGLSDLVLLRAMYVKDLYNAIKNGNQKALDKWVNDYKADPSNKEELSWYEDEKLDVKKLRKELAEQEAEYDRVHAQGRTIFGEGTGDSRVNESLIKKDIKPGLKLQLNSNITVYGFKDKNGNDRKDLKDAKLRWLDSAVDEIKVASDGNMSISKSKTQLKLTPGCTLTIEEVMDSGKLCVCSVGKSKNLKLILSERNYDYSKVDPYGAAPKEPKEKQEAQYAIYGCPDIYGRAGTQWHWTQKEDYESEKEFKNGVKYSAKRRAEQEYREYDPRSIKTMYFSSKDAFLKQCNKLGIKPKLD